MSTIQQFSVIGLHCESCVETVTRRLSEHPALTEVRVTREPDVASLSMRTKVPLPKLNEWLAAAGDYRLESLADAPAAPEPSPAAASSYRPLVLVLAYLVAVIAAVMLASQSWDTAVAMRLFMGGFFIAFSFFKLLDPAGFARTFRTYDIVAARVPLYGRVYPWIELALGLAYLADVWPLATNLLTALVMGVGLIGVWRAVRSKKQIRCACLGTVFNLPMSTVTIIENTIMLLMAVAAMVHG